MSERASRELALDQPAAVDPIRVRVTALMIFCTVFAGLVLVRATMIQVFKDPRLEQMAKRQFQSKVLIRPRRGVIVDRNGEHLAINMDRDSLAANPSKVDNPRALAKLISRALDIPYKKVLSRVGGSREFVWIKRHLSESDLKALKKWHIIEPDGELMAGMLMVKESKRVYPHGELAAHVLGSVNVDSEGLEGVELWQNEKMSGKVLSVTAIKDARGRPTFIDAVTAKSVQDHRDGEAVTLTIDASLQFAAEQQLKAAVTKANAKGGTVIVMNAVNGEILAMANQPAFNPNESGIPVDRRRNRALTDGFEPGSTLKAVLAASALSHGWKSSDLVWGEHGSFKIQGKRISEAESHEKFEWLSLSKMIEVSSNVGAAKIALKIGADNYLGTLKSMEFGSKTGVGFPGEISGQVPARKTWQPLTLANIGFGQGILVTPMQMVRAYASFLNGGWLVEPKLIKETKEVARASSDDAAADAPKRVLSEKVAAQILDMLEGPVKEGTAKSAALPGYRVAGKTGTAQKIDPVTKSYSRAHYVASFIGMPLDVEPKVVVFAAIDEPRGIYYGGQVAAPLFREVLNAVANRFSMPSRPELVKRALAENSKNAQSGNGSIAGVAAVTSAVDALKVSQAHPAPAAEAALELKWQGSNAAGLTQWVMPSLKGLTPREALRAMQGHRFHMEVRGTGVIHTQSPEAGKTLTEGETVKVSLGDI